MKREIPTFVIAVKAFVLAFVCYVQIDCGPAWGRWIAWPLTVLLLIMGILLSLVCIGEKLKPHPPKEKINE